MIILVETIYFFYNNTNGMSDHRCPLSTPVINSDFVSNIKCLFFKIILQYTFYNNKKTTNQMFAI